MASIPTYHVLGDPEIGRGTDPESSFPCVHLVTDGGFGASAVTMRLLIDHATARKIGEQLLLVADPRLTTMLFGQLQIGNAELMADLDRVIRSRLNDDRK
ncbi:MAG: hypothetical protein ABMB14_24025 [Myxococcota bacterium]